MRHIVIVWIVAAALAVSGGRVIAADKLASYSIDKNEISVSGISSGAYMAGQFHVAFSASLKGAGIIAGGPYDCAQGLVTNALYQCMKTTLGGPDPAALFAGAQERAAAGEIDDPTNLTGDKVYLFAGTRDATVLPEVVAQVPAFYAAAGLPAGNLLFVDDLVAGHAMITEDFGGACGETGSPFINDCDYDQAGEILKHIYGALDAPDPDDPGRLIAFDQSEFLGDPKRHGMNEIGYVFVPGDCEGDADCRLHVAFHGCKQTTDHIGEQFPTHAGYNAWAASNGIVVLYPQAWATSTNPNGCWDWWGYDDADYATKTGRQMAAVKAMIDRLAGATNGGGYCQRYEDGNYQHWLDGRAELCQFYLACAKGSGDVLGSFYGRATLYEHPQGNFTTAPCGS